MKKNIFALLILIGPYFYTHAETLCAGVGNCSNGNTVGGLPVMSGPSSSTSASSIPQYKNYLSTEQNMERGFASNGDGTYSYNPDLAKKQLESKAISDATANPIDKYSDTNGEKLGAAAAGTNVDQQQTATSNDTSSSQVEAPEMSGDKSVNDAYNKFLNEPSDANEAAYKQALANAKDNANSNSLTSNSFMFSANELSPAKTKWTSGPSDNTKKLLGDIVRYLLMGITSFAALFMVVGGIKIITAGGESSEIQNGKKIITYNIIAIVVSLLSYSIINLVTWIIGAST